MKPKILVTGGLGYIGSHTVVELANNGYDPVIIDNLSNSEESVLSGINSITERQIAFYEGDCNDNKFLNDLFDKEGFAGVIHFAAFKSVNESVNHPLKYYHNNINSLLVLLEAMNKYDVRDLVFSSSCTVYGQPDDLPVTESSPLKPAESPYGETKQICEGIIKDYIKSGVQIQAVALRYFNPIGAHPSSDIGELPLGIPNNLVPLITQTAAGIRDELIIYGDDYGTTDGTCIRDYIHVVDLAKAHVKTLDYLKGINAGFEIFNLGTGQGNSVLEVVQTFMSVTGTDLNYKIGERRPGDVEQVYANVDKSKSVLNWETEFNLEDALLHAWEWQKKLIKKTTT